MVKCVGRFPADLQAQALLDPEVLEDRDVRALEDGRGQSVAANSKRTAKDLIGIQGVVDPVNVVGGYGFESGAGRTASSADQGTGRQSAIVRKIHSHRLE